MFPAKYKHLRNSSKSLSKTQKIRILEINLLLVRSPKRVEVVFTFSELETTFFLELRLDIPE